MIARRQRDESKDFLFFFLIVLAEKARVSRTLSDMRAERFYFFIFIFMEGKRIWLVQ